jgi:hypothetical protein
VTAALTSMVVKRDLTILASNNNSWCWLVGLVVVMQEERKNEHEEQRCLFVIALLRDRGWEIPSNLLE